LLHGWLRARSPSVVGFTSAAVMDPVEASGRAPAGRELVAVEPAAVRSPVPASVVAGVGVWSRVASNAFRVQVLFDSCRVIPG